MNDPQIASVTATQAVERPPSFAVQVCRRVHPAVEVEQVFGACDQCKQYVLVVLQSDWLVNRDVKGVRLARAEALAPLRSLTSPGAATITVNGVGYVAQSDLIAALDA